MRKKQYYKNIQFSFHARIGRNIETHRIFFLLRLQILKIIGIQTLATGNGTVRRRRFGDAATGLFGAGTIRR